MTKKRKFKKLVRDHAARTDQSYRTARDEVLRKGRSASQAPPSWPPTLDMLERIDGVEHETIGPEGRDWMPKRFSFWFADHSWSPVPQMIFAVGYTVLAEMDGPLPRLEPGRAVTIVWRRKTPDDASCGQAFEQARTEYPAFDWVEGEFIHNAAMPGAGPPYWIQMVTIEPDGTRRFHTGKGVSSLREFLGGLQPPVPPG